MRTTVDPIGLTVERRRRVVTEVLQRLLGVSLVIFMVGNLLEMGLKLDLRQAGGAVRDGRFLALSVLWAFVLCPALALLLTKLIPMGEPYALGLLFLGMAPCAPFLPAVSQRARGDLAYVAAFMLLAVAGTVIFMPLAVPLLVNGFTTDAWTIVRPLLYFVLAPLSVGAAVRRGSARFAEMAHPIVRRATVVDTLIMVLGLFVVYGRDFLDALGSYAIAAQILHGTVVPAAAYGLGFGLPPSRRSVLALGVCSRNVGAALAPLLAAGDTDRRTIAMCALAVPVTVISAFVWARVFARRALAAEAVAAQAGSRNRTRPDTRS
jgi:bile acid:Na+ symporter, BASS family